MFSLERGMRYWLYSEPTDMRKSFHTLSGLVRNKIGGDPMNGDVYIFVNKRRNSFLVSSLKLRGTYGSRFLDEPSDKVERRIKGS